MKPVKYIFDLDTTLSVEGILPSIAALSGDEPARELKNVPYVESVIRSVLAFGDFPASQVDAGLENIDLHTQVLDFIRLHVHKCVVVTQYPECWMERLLRKIGCEYYCSHAHVLDDRVMKLAEILHKETIVEKFIGQGYRVVYAGGSGGDQEAMRLADVSIAVSLSADPVTEYSPVTDYHVFNPDALCRQLSQLL